MDDTKENQDFTSKKKRRSSILKGFTTTTAFQEIAGDVTQSVGEKKRRVSFSYAKEVKEFIVGENPAVTLWNHTYEEKHAEDSSVPKKSELTTDENKSLSTDSLIEDGESSLEFIASLMNRNYDEQDANNKSFFAALDDEDSQVFENENVNDQRNTDQTNMNMTKCVDSAKEEMNKTNVSTNPFMDITRCVDNVNRNEMNKTNVSTPFMDITRCVNNANEYNNIKDDVTKKWNQTTISNYDMEVTRCADDEDDTTKALNRTSAFTFDMEVTRCVGDLNERAQKLNKTTLQNYDMDVTECADKIRDTVKRLNHTTVSNHDMEMTQGIESSAQGTASNLNRTTLFNYDMDFTECTNQLKKNETIVDNRRDDVEISERENEEYEKNEHTKKLNSTELNNCDMEVTEECIRRYGGVNDTDRTTVSTYEFTERLSNEENVSKKSDYQRVSTLNEQEDRTTVMIAEEITDSAGKLKGYKNTELYKEETVHVTTYFENVDSKPDEINEIRNNIIPPNRDNDAIIHAEKKSNDENDAPLQDEDRPLIHDNKPTEVESFPSPIIQRQSRDEKKNKDVSNEESISKISEDIRNEVVNESKVEDVSSLKRDETFFAKTILEIVRQERNRKLAQMEEDDSDTSEEMEFIPSPQPVNIKQFIEKLRQDDDDDVEEKEKEEKQEQRKDDDNDGQNNNNKKDHNDKGANEDDVNKSEFSSSKVTNKLAEKPRISIFEHWEKEQYKWNDYAYSNFEIESSSSSNSRVVLCFLRGHFRLSFELGNELSTTESDTAMLRQWDIQRISHESHDSSDPFINMVLRILTRHSVRSSKLEGICRTTHDLKRLLEYVRPHVFGAASMCIDDYKIGHNHSETGIDPSNPDVYRIVFVSFRFYFRLDIDFRNGLNAVSVSCSYVRGNLNIDSVLKIAEKTKSSWQFLRDYVKKVDMYIAYIDEAYLKRIGV